MSASTPLVSVIVACGEGRGELAPCLRHLVREGGGGLEVILAVGGLMRGGAVEAERVAASLGLPVRVIEVAGPPAPNVARRAGLEAAGGKYVVFLDAGDLVGRGQLGESIAKLEGEVTLDLVYRDWEVWSEREGRAPDFEFWPALERVDLRREALAGVPYPLSALTMRRAIAERMADVGGLDPEVRAGSARVALLLLSVTGAEAIRVEGEPVRVRSRHDAFSSSPGRDEERVAALGWALRHFARLSEARGIELSPFERAIVDAPLGPHRLSGEPVNWTDWSFAFAPPLSADAALPWEGKGGRRLTPVSSLAGGIALALWPRAHMLRGRGFDEVRRCVWQAFGWRREAMEPLVLALDELRRAGFVAACEGPEKEGAP
jgi:glycosyl transferase family 2